MKLSIKCALLVYSCLALSLTSCEKSNEGDGITKEDKSVALKIIMGSSDSPSLRSATDSIVDGTALTFTSGYLYFVSQSGQITKRLSISAGSDPVSATGVGIETLTGGVTIENVPANSMQVYFFGNAPVGTDMTTGGNISVFKEKMIHIETQSDGTGGVTKASLYGFNDLLGGPTDYAAVINVKPLIARIEIAKFYTDPALLGEYKVDGIFINKYYSKEQFDTIKHVSNFVNNGSTETNYVGGGASYPAGFDKITYDYALSGGLGTYTGANGTYAPNAGSNVWAYNVFAGPVPHMVIRLSGISGYTDPQFITVKGFKQNGLSLTALEPGKVYRIANLAFTPNDLSEEPELGSITAEITVVLIPWKTIDVTPEL